MSTQETLVAELNDWIKLLNVGYQYLICFYPTPKLACFVLCLKIINTFLENSICILQ